MGRGEDATTPLGVVLVVDDCTHFASSLARHLGAAGYPVVVAHSEDAARARVSGASITAAVIDYFLAGRGGDCLALVAALRAAYPHARFLVVSADPSHVRGERARRAGADAYGDKSSRAADYLCFLAGGPYEVSTPHPIDARPHEAARIRAIHASYLVHRGNLSATARELGMTRYALRQILREHPEPPLLPKPSRR